MGKSRICVTAGIFLLILALSGCESIILDADVNKATVTAYTPPEPTVPESVAVQTDQELTKEKYAIQGTEAFYILPAHRPGPEMILDFKILDFIDGTTMIYAYQALDASGDSSGLGGAAEQGTAQDQDNNAGEAVTNTETMATILMAYQVNTHQYRVLFHQTSLYDKASVSEWDESSDSTERFDSTEETETGDGSETGSFFAQKVGEESGRYFFYFDGVGRVYDETGRLIYEKSIQDVLDYNTSRYGGDNAAVTISNVVMDTNYFMYLTLNIEREGSQIDENTEAEDLAEEENSVVQMLYYCFSYDIGEPEDPSEGEESYFRSSNMNYDQQTASWEAADQQTYELGLLDGAPDAETAARIVEENGGDLMSESMIRSMYPDAFEIYHYYNTQLNLQLYSFVPQKQSWYLFWRLGWYMKWDDNKWTRFFGRPELEPVVPAAMDEWYNPSLPKSNYSHYTNRSFVAGIPDAQGDLKIYLLDREKKPEAQTLNQTERTRTYKLIWEEEVVSEEEDSEAEASEEDADVGGDASGESNVTIETFEATVTETMTFTESCETRFKGEVFVNWSEDIYTTDMIAASPGSGVLRYGSENEGEENLEKQTTFVQWMINAQGDFSAAGISGAPQNAVLCREKQSEDGRLFLFAATSNGLTIFPGTANRTGEWTPSSFGQEQMYIPYSEVNFGVSMDSGGMEEINQVVLDDPVDQELTDSPIAGSDEYTSNTLLIRREEGSDFLYLAGLENGLVKYNLSSAKDAAGKCGQLSPYPYYAIWEDEKGNGSFWAVGYQSSDYAYSSSDISCAKLYHISLYDGTAASNLVVSALSMDRQLRAQILQGSERNQSWSNMIENLGISSADLSQVELYQEFLLEGESQREEALLAFYQLAAISPENRTEELAEQALSSYYANDLENIIVSVKGRDEDADRQTILKETREQAGLTSQQWRDRLTELAFLMQDAETIEEFLQKKSVLLFAQMAGTVPDSAIKTRLAGCRTEAELETELARYYLDSETLFLLDGADDNTAPEELARARQKQADALEKCRDAYLENGYEETENGKVYWKYVYGTTWNQSWQQLWSRNLTSILDAFHPTEEGDS